MRSEIMTYEIYANGKKIVTVAKWKTVVKKVNEQQQLGRHGDVIETFPNRIKPDLLVWSY